ncbi:MAG: flagellar protein FliS, partial [Burkholderiales bacterium]|nr:flagellar protein FliS [Burkholderiales bacterium]
MFSAPFTSAPRAKQFAGAYQQVGLQTSVSDASPHQLILMLFDGLFAALQRAQTALAAGDIATKSQAIAHAVRIIDEGL